MSFFSKPYQPNASAFLALCGRNYVRLCRYLPQQWDEKQQQISTQIGRLQLELIEQTPYTQLIGVRRQQVASSSLMQQWLPQKPILVRVYHDAKLAEVLTGQQTINLKAVYDYPNLHMYHPNEKYQVNVFLEELLKAAQQLPRLCSSS